MFWQELMEEVTNASIPFLYEGNEKLQTLLADTTIVANIEGWFIYLFNKRKKRVIRCSVLYSVPVSTMRLQKVVSFAKGFINIDYCKRN